MASARVARRTALGAMIGAAAGLALGSGLGRARIAGAAPLAQEGEPDLVLRNANVITMDPRQPAAQAVAVRGGRIVAVGSNQQADGWVGRATLVRDLGGQTLLPGFYDSHNHMLRTGLNLGAVDLSGTKSVAEVLAALVDRAAGTAAGEWVVSSSRWHEAQLAEARFPRREELDAAVPNHPVMIRRGGHNVVLNSLAFQKAGISRDTPDPPGGTYVKDPASGELSGHIIGLPAFARVLRLLPATTAQDRLEALRAVQSLYRQAGLTSVIEPGLQPPEMAAYQALADGGELTARVSMMWGLEPGTTDETLRQALDALASGQVEPRLNDAWLRVIGIKLVADGGVETGYHRQPYAYTDDPSSPNGKPRMSLEAMTAFCQEAARRGWMVGTHCVGDAAISQVLDAYTATNASVPIADLRWTLIHMMLARPDHWEQVNQLKLAITAQQPLMYALAAGFLKYLGPERTMDIEPLRAYLSGSQQPVGGGSDSPVTPYPPLLGIWSSVTRMTELVGVQGPEWAIGVDEALRMYTLGSAWCAFEEQVKGSVEVGKYADLVALSADPRSVEPDAIKEIGVELTMVDGRVVHDRAEGPAQPAASLRPTTPFEEGCVCQHLDGHDLVA